jgi:Ca-activated chloride channel homolog
MTPKALPSRLLIALALAAAAMLAMGLGFPAKQLPTATQPEQLSPETLAEPATEELTANPVTPEAYTYDPTNGTTSEGDVYRTRNGHSQEEVQSRIAIHGERLPTEAMATFTVDSGPDTLRGQAPLNPSMIAGTPSAHLSAIAQPSLTLRSSSVLPPSTGGQRPVNAQLHDAMFFEHHGTNPFVDVDLDSLLTFGLDVDTASYTVARRFLLEGTMPPREAVRVEEFVNYFDWDIAPPEEGDFAIHADGAPSRFGGESRHLLRIGIRGREVAAQDRPDANLTFVIDTSGSMRRENRLGLVQRALRLLVNGLRPSDQIAIVEYGSQARLIMPHTPVQQRGMILDAIDRLHPNGSTNAEAGLAIGYGEAARMFNSDKINHVILCSDGVANVGQTGAGGILERIRLDAERGITLTAIGFGMDNCNDVLLERLADEGDGRYAYVDTISEARRIFVEGATGTLQVIAREARAQVDFNPEVVRSYRLLGYENRDIADERFRDDTVDAGEIGAGHRVTVLVELRLWEEGEGEIGTVHLRWGHPDGEEFEEMAHTIITRDLAPTFGDASPELRLAACVAEMAEVLRGSHWAQESDLDDVLTAAQFAVGDLGASDTEVLEFLNLLAQARDLQSRGAEPGTGG